jgi:7,8-dihydro-6-hydroxymethylpterin-pyrophosphokinase
MTNDTRSTEANLTVYLGLGSNVGDRQANLGEAVARIEKLGVEVTRESSIYETEPVGFKDQRWFLNKVIEGRIFPEIECALSVRQAASLSEPPPKVVSEDNDKLAACRTSVVEDPEIIATVQAEALLSALLKIENDLGRERSIVNGPRVIDIDLLLFGDRIIDHSKEDNERTGIEPIDVSVPHPRMHLRRFVLEPLCEIAPESIHPVLRKTCRELLASLDDPSIVRRYDPTFTNS